MPHDESELPRASRHVKNELNGSGLSRIDRVPECREVSGQVVQRRLASRRSQVNRAGLVPEFAVDITLSLWPSSFVLRVRRDHDKLPHGGRRSNRSLSRCAVDDETPFIKAVRLAERDPSRSLKHGHADESNDIYSHKRAPSSKHTCGPLGVPPEQKVDAPDQSDSRDNQGREEQQISD